MKLNPDCIRDLLLYYESITNGQRFVRFDTDVLLKDKNLSKYTADELYYHFRQCEYSGMFINVNHYMSGNATLLDISPQAHEFINNIRTDGVWEKVKEKATKIGSFSIDALSKIAVSVISALITAQFKQ